MFFHIPVRLLAIVWCVLLLAGCTSGVDLAMVRTVHEISELTQLLGPLDCRRKGKFRKCLYQRESFNLFLLECKSQTFSFLIDDSGLILERQLSQSSTQYHLLPQISLPSAFEEFK